MRLITLIFTVLVLMAVAIYTVVWTKTPTREDLLRQAHLVGKSQMLIGVLDDEPGVSYRDPATGQYSGFDIDIAYMVASDLGFGRSAVRFLPVESKDRGRMQARDGDQFVTVDLVIASFSITPDREKQPGVTFSAPYLRTAQSVITRRGDPDNVPTVQSFADLKGKKVCTITTSTSHAFDVPGLIVIPKNKFSECVDALLHHTVDAATTDAVILAGFAHEYPEQLQLNPLGIDVDEQWGINTGDNQALRKLVNLSLYHSKYDPADHRWEDAFERNLRPEQKDSLPQEVANDQQPSVAKVQVREWPWQAVAPAGVGTQP